MTTITQQPRIAEAQFRSGFRDRHSAEWLFQQTAMGDPLSRFGKRVFVLEEDFVVPASFADGGPTSLVTFDALNDGTTGTNAFQDAAGGWYNVVTAAADNDYHALATPNEVFKFAANKPLWFEVIFKVAEAQTGLDAAFWFGLSDTLTTGGLQANDSGPLASYDGALWWKGEGGSTFNFETSNAGTQDTESDVFTFEDDTLTRLGFYFDGAATTASIRPFYSVNGDIWNLKEGPITTIPLSGLEEMHLIAGGIKAGPGGTAETLQLDYVRCAQVR